MSSKLRISRTGLDLIKGFEGFRDHAARLPDGRWIVGYGHVKSAREGLSITEQDADELLKSDLKPVEDAIQSLVFAPLRQNQFDALVSLAFNISPGQFKDSDVLRALNAGDEINAANGFDAWRRARVNGRLIVVDALVRRRAAEKALFLEHPGGRPVAPTQLVTPELDPSVTSAVRDAPQLRSNEPVTMAAATNEPASSVPHVATAVAALAEARSAQPPPQTGVSSAAAAAQAAAPANPVLAGRSVSDQPAAESNVQPSQGRATARQVTERLAKILEKGEQEQQARAAARVVEIPDYDARRAVTGARSRKLIDDTEVIDPGKDADTLFAEGLRAQRRHQARGGGMVLNGGVWRIAPWIGFLAIAIAGLAVTLSLALRDRTQDAVAAGPLAGASVFAVLAFLSIYFIATRGPERRE